MGKLAPAMDAVFTVDAYPGQRFNGKVRQIRNAAQTLQNVVTYNAVIDVANPELKLRPGMTASVAFVHARRDDVLRVRNAALRFRPSPELIAKMRDAGRTGSVDGAASAQPRQRTRAEKTADGDDDPTRRTVWVLRGKQPEPVPIKLGISDGTHTEVSEGALRPGDAVITEATDSSAPRGAGTPRIRMF